MNVRRWGGILLLSILLLPVISQAQPIQVWLNSYATQSQTSQHLIQTSDGGFAHCVQESYSGDILYLLDAGGQVISHHTYGETGNYDKVVDLVQLPDGGFLLAGYAWIDDQAAYDARLIRTNAAGEFVWEVYAGDETETDYGFGLVRTDEGRVFMVGQMWNGSQSDGAVWEFNDDGDLINTSLFNGGPYSAGFRNIDLTSDNHLVMSGGGYFTLNNYDGWAVKCDLDGNEVWNTVLFKEYFQMMTDIHESQDGYFIFAGNTTLEDSFDPPAHPWYGRLDADGNEVYDLHYGDCSDDSYFMSCALDQDGNWLLAGRMEGAEPHQDALLLKIDPEDGSVIWDLLLGDDPPGSDEGFSDIILDQDGSYILGGDGDFGELTHPAFNAMYNDTGSGVERVVPASQPSELRLASVYPNPFNASATVQLELPAPGELTIEVINISGQVVATLHSGWTSAGTHTYSWTANGLASGIYIVRATVPGEGPQLQKVALIR